MGLDNQAISMDQFGVGTMTIVDGGPLNIISSTVATALTESLRDLGREPTLRALIIRGTGSKTFIGGADIHEMADLDTRTATDFIRSLYILCDAIRLFPVPTIAQIDGWCIGVGLELAASCDVRYGSTQSRFTMPEVRLGIPSVIQAALLSRIVGEGRARWLMLSGDVIDAQTALAWGLLNGAVEPEQLSSTVGAFASRLAECGTACMRIQKRLLIDWEAPYLNDVTRQSIDRFGEAFQSGEPRQFMGAFLRKDRGDPS